MTNQHIERKPLESAPLDLMAGAGRWEIRLHDHGFLALVDVMPRLVPEGQTGDSAIVQAARVSYGQGTKKLNQDRGLIRYLLRHRHTTPFEMVEFKFHVAMPLFVARQWVRHRTANINEYSARYSVMPDRFYRPDVDGVRGQSSTNRQGSGAVLDGDSATDFMRYLDHVEDSYRQYSDLVERGVARELARIGLPLNTYTEWYWKCDLHNILHFIALRIDEHAQQEIREYAQAMLDLIRPIVPLTVEAFEDYRLDSVELTRLELEALQRGGELETDNRREQQEWQAKRERLGLSSAR
jgi:thymidylate synthase (FAD)